MPLYPPDPAWDLAVPATGPGWVPSAGAPDRAGARRALYFKAAAMKELGIRVSFCGEI